MRWEGGRGTPYEAHWGYAGRLMPNVEVASKFQLETVSSWSVLVLNTDGNAMAPKECMGNKRKENHRRLGPLSILEVNEVQNKAQKGKE